jgi:hypothetical protein
MRLSWCRRYWLFWLLVTALTVTCLALLIFERHRHGETFRGRPVADALAGPITINKSQLSALDASFIDILVRNVVYDSQANNQVTADEWQRLKDIYGLTPQFVLASINFGATQLEDGFYDATLPGRIGLLNSVYKSGTADYPALLLLYCYRERWDWEHDQPPESNIDSHDVQDDLGIAQDWQKHCPKANSALGRVTRQLLDDLHRSAPQQAMPCYLEAIQCCREARYAAAQRWLQQGNAAPQCDFPAGPPYDEFWTEASQGRTPGGDPVVMGLVYLPSFDGLRYYQQLTVSQATKLLAVSAVKEQRPRLLNDLNLALCRMIAAAPVGYWGKREYDPCFKALIEAAQELNGLAPSHYTESLLEYQTAVNSLELVWGGLTCGTGLAGNAEEQRKSRLQRLREEGRQQIAECQRMAQNNPPILNHLQHYDFVSMSWKLEPDQR